MRKLAVFPAFMAGALLLAGCGGEPASNTASAPPAASAIATTGSGEASGENSTDDGHATEHYEGPNLTWDASSEARVRETAAKAMKLFGRPDVPESTWFAELQPLLAAEYAEDARYIDPARIPFSAVTDGPSISREAQNPMTVTASFYTNEGPWDMMLHRIGQDDLWLVTSISPKAAQ